VDVGTDDGRTCCHRLEQDDAERLTPRCGRDVDLGCLVELGLLGVRDPTEELDALETTGGYVSTCLPLLWTRPDDQEPRSFARPSQHAMGLEQV